MTAAIQLNTSFTDTSLPTIPNWDTDIGAHAHVVAWLVPDKHRVTFVSGHASAVADRLSGGDGFTQATTSRQPSWNAAGALNRPTLHYDGNDNIVGGTVVPIDADLSFACLIAPTYATTADNEYVMYAGSSSGFAALYGSNDGRWVFDVGDGSTNRVRALSSTGVKAAGTATLLVGSYNYASKSAKLTINQSSTLTGFAATVASVTSGVLNVGMRVTNDFGITGHIYDAIVADIHMHDEADLLATYVNYINGRYGLDLSTTAP